MSCVYYYWNNHYACRKANKDIDEDTYYKYCRNYDYCDCPIYKGQLPSDSGGCYLTSACVTARGLADDCYELQTLRHFRDTYLLLQKDGQQEVDDYYKVAPQIVAAIMQNENPMIELDMIYSELVWPCVKFIEQGEYDQAYLLYKNTTRALESKYIVKGE